MEAVKRLARILFFAAAAATFFSCSPNIPDGQGLLVVETEDDNLYLESVYAKKAGEAAYTRVWTKKHGLDWTHGNVYLDAGFYKVYATTAWLGAVPMISTTGFAEIEIRNGETKFLHVNGLFLSE